MFRLSQNGFSRLRLIRRQASETPTQNLYKFTELGYWRSKMMWDLADKSSLVIYNKSKKELARFNRALIFGQFAMLFGSWTVAYNNYYINTFIKQEQSEFNRKQAEKAINDPSTVVVSIDKGSSRRLAANNSKIEEQDFDPKALAAESDQSPSAIASAVSKGLPKGAIETTSSSWFQYPLTVIFALVPIPLIAAMNMNMAKQVTKVSLRNLPIHINQQTNHISLPNRLGNRAAEKVKVVFETHPVFFGLKPGKKFELPLNDVFFKITYNKKDQESWTLITRSLESSYQLDRTLEEDGSVIYFDRHSVTKFVNVDIQTQGVGKKK